MALADAAPRQAPKGRARPRLAPPTPARSDWRAVHDMAAEIGIDLFPWQDNANRYIYALGPGDRWLYPEVAIVVARQNGKTRLLVPLIVSRLRAGQRIMHTAQNRELPREVFGEVADIMQQDPKALRRKPRFANGQEEIRTTKGGFYRIVAPTRGGARGPSNDLVIIDELREMTDHSFLAAARPTLQASANPQVLYLSNAGETDSAVLNSVRQRANVDPSLAYLEWSAAPERNVSDRAGWYEANPAIGHLPQLFENLERDHRSHKLAGTLAIFETENLCRWVDTMMPPILDVTSWERLRGEVGRPLRPMLGISTDPSGTRASAVLAWQQPDERLALRVIAEVFGDQVHMPKFGAELRQLALRYGVVKVGYDSATDAELAKYFKNVEPVTGAKFANASASFVNAANAGRIVWSEADVIGTDLKWAGRKSHEAKGVWSAVQAKEDRPVTAVLAAIRAIGLASGPKIAAPRVM